MIIDKCTISSFHPTLSSVDGASPTAVNYQPVMLLIVIIDSLIDAVNLYLVCTHHPVITVNRPFQSMPAYCYELTQQLVLQYHQLEFGKAVSNQHQQLFIQ